MADKGGKGEDVTDVYQVKDPEKLASNMMAFFGEGARALTRYMDDKRQDGPYAIANELTEASKLLGAIAQRWMAEPEKLAERQTKLTEDLVDLWGRTYRRFMGQEVEPVAKPDRVPPRLLAIMLYFEVPVVTFGASIFSDALFEPIFPVA